jgi:predicted DNA-binding transcriptional regulator AlpA
METIEPGVTGRRSRATTQRLPSGQTARGPPEPEGPKKKRKLVGIRVLMDRYSSSDRTIDRWTIDPKLGFPKPIKIKRRRFWWEDELDEFDASRG